MPRIRRWFHVSHDINEDPEVWELTDTFGDWLLRVWLQMLSIGDRNNFYIKGDRRWIESRMSVFWKSNSKRYNTEWRANRVRMALDWMQNKGWIRIELGGIFIVNQAKYNPRRDTKEIPQGELTSSPPILSSPILSLKTPKRTLSASADRSLLNGFGKLWETYPEPRGPKAPALKAYKEKKPPPEALVALEAQIAHKAECDRQNQFWPSLPHMVRWIKQERWTDEIPNISKDDDNALDREIKRIRRDIHGDKETG